MQVDIYLRDKRIIYKYNENLNNIKYICTIEKNKIKKKRPYYNHVAKV